MKRCKYPSCDRKHFAKGLCETHYNRERTGVDPTKSIKVFFKDPLLRKLHTLNRHKKYYQARKDSIPDGVCRTDRCGKKAERGRQCFDCWVRAKWRGMKQRVEDTRNKAPAYKGLPLGFTEWELVDWAKSNPPPDDMKHPSIDKIIDSKGYVFGNIRWLELLVNVRQGQKDVPEGYWKCLLCGETKSHTFEFFSRHAGRKNGLHGYCRPCYNASMVRRRAEKKLQHSS